MDRTRLTWRAFAAEVLRIDRFAVFGEDTVFTL
jgi:hypothetical protein